MLPGNLLLDHIQKLSPAHRSNQSAIHSFQHLQTRVKQLVSLQVSLLIEDVEINGPPIDHYGVLTAVPLACYYQHPHFYGHLIRMAVLQEPYYIVVRPVPGSFLSFLCSSLRSLNHHVYTLYTHFNMHE